MHGLTFVGASFFFGDWDATPPAQRKREYSNIRYMAMTDPRKRPALLSLPSCRTSDDSHLGLLAFALGDADAHLRER